MKRFFCSQKLSDATREVRLNIDETHHLLNVLRMKKGDQCLLVDGQGGQAIVELLDDDSTEALFSVESFSIVEKSSTRIKVFIAFLKKGKMDELVDKAQQWGVDELIPLSTEHCDFSIPNEKFEKVRERWVKLTQVAAKQSGSSYLMNIGEPASFEKALNSCESEETVVLLHPDENALSVKEYIQGLESAPQSVSLLIGPEGGFSEKEVESFLGSDLENKEVLHMGENILRADTAVISAISIFKTMLSAS